MYHEKILHFSVETKAEQLKDENYQIIIIVQTEGCYLFLNDQSLLLQIEEHLQLPHDI